MQIQNEVAPDDPDNFMHYLHRITIITEQGRLCLEDTTGGVMWYGKMFVPVHDANTTIHADSSFPGTGPFSVGFEATFEKAFIRYFEDGYQDGRTETKLEIFTDEKHEEVKLVPQNCYELVCHNVVESILENKTSRLDIEHALLTLETIAAIEKIIKGKK